MKKIILISVFIGVSVFATPLEYLNEKRSKAGMSLLSKNSILDQSSQNHADYVKTNIYTVGYEGHYETDGNPNYTGYAPWDRARALGYQASASENMTVGFNTYEKSIDGLYTAIYHRLGFMSFNIDEIGFGESINTQQGNLYTHVYNMGNSDLVGLCEGETFSGVGQYYFGICLDSEFRIEASLYQDTKNENILENPVVVTWPYENQIDFQPMFFEESPDPLPSCSVSGNPISIQFNPLKSGEIVKQSFKLYDQNNTEITNVTLMDEDSDHNGHFSSNDFALFPMERLDFGAEYKAEFIYTEDGISKTKEWKFYTKTLPNSYYVASTGSLNTFDVLSGKTYSIYVPPTDCNDSRASYTYGYLASDFVINSVDANTYEVTLTGSNGNYSEITLNNGTVLKLIIANSDSATEPNIVPIAFAGEDQTVNYGDTITLDGTSSYDLDGNITSYEWIDGNTVLSNSATFSISDLIAGEHVITLKVTDDQGKSTTDKIIVTVLLLDTDGDGISNHIDNCPIIVNQDQLNTDGDLEGNACDNDDDNDGILDDLDSNPLDKFLCKDNDLDSCNDCTSGIYNPNDDGLDTDGNGICNIGDTDDDGDGMPDSYESSNGLNSLVDDGDDDLDNDGVTNFGEYRDGTNPDNATSKYFYITLKEGWNLVAFELNSSVATSSLEVHGTVELIRVLKNGQWYSWIKNNSSHSDQALTEMEDGYGYWVKASQDGFIKVKGNGLANTLTITPNQWNMLGSQKISDINQFFVDNPDVKMIWKYQDGKYHAVSSDNDIDSDLTPLESSGDVIKLQSIEKNEGFFVK